MHRRGIALIGLAAALSIACGRPELSASEGAQAVSDGAQSATVDTTALAARVATMEHAIEAQRVRLKVPGAGVVVVQGDRVILLKGFGLRNVEAGLPVTPHTLFNIASCTKPFTALATLISADRAVLSLDDAPKKYLPYFALRDPEANASVTLRDMLSHRTGVPDDLGAGWFERFPTHEALIRAAMQSKPIGGFRERLLYNNYMFLAVGEAIAVAYHAPFESIMTSRVLGPLGMRTSTFSIGAMQATRDFSFGYSDDAARRVVSMDKLAFLTGIAPAGGIHSNAEDMAQWLRVMLGRGVLGATRIVSDGGYNAMLAPAVQTAGGHYGLGLFIEQWHGLRLYSHPGGVPGFGSRCEFLPDQGVGWVVLTNVDDQQFPKAIREVVYEQLLVRR